MPQRAQQFHLARQRLQQRRRRSGRLPSSSPRWLSTAGVSWKMFSARFSASRKLFQMDPSPCPADAAPRATSQAWGVDPQCRPLPRSVRGPRGFRWRVRMGRRAASRGVRPRAPCKRPCSAADGLVRRASRIGAVWPMPRPREAVPYFSHALGAQIQTKRLGRWVIRGPQMVDGHQGVVPSAAGPRRRMERTVGRPGPAGDG